MKYATVLVSMILSGCGTFVPALSYHSDDQMYTSGVHASIQCEVVDAIHETYRQKGRIESLRGTNISFFEDWGLLYTLTLNVVENTKLDPSLKAMSLPPGNVVFTLNSGLNLSAKATRKETTQVFSVVRSLAKEAKCEKRPKSNIQLVGNKLGLGSWLRTQLSLVDLGVIKSLTPKESFTYQMTFEIVRSANVNPSWTFAKGNLSQTSGIFATGRTTSHTVLFTFGPTTKDRLQLEESALVVHTANLIGDAVNRQ